VVGVAERVKTLAAQGRDGSFSGVREDDILTTALETPEHRGRSMACLVNLTGVKGSSEEFAGMYRKKRNKRNKRSDAHDVMADRIFKSIVHALRLSGNNIPKNALLPSQLPAPVSSSEEEDMDGIEEKDGHDNKEFIMMSGRKILESEIIGMPTLTKRMKCTVIVDHLCWTQ
jgi:hypothetical protein